MFLLIQDFKQEKGCVCICTELPRNDLVYFNTTIKFHCQLDIYPTLLVRLCDLVAPLVGILCSSTRKQNKIQNKISKLFYSS